MTQPIYKGELQLARWSDTSTGGAQVTFWLPDGEALEAFKALTARKGGKAGQILAAIIACVDETEHMEPQPEPCAQNAQQEMKGGELAKLAAMFVQSDEFMAWVRNTFRAAAIHNVTDLDRWLKAFCGVQSKRELDHNPEAARYFHDGIRKPFVEWQQRNGRAAA